MGGKRRVSRESKKCLVTSDEWQNKRKWSACPTKLGERSGVISNQKGKGIEVKKKESNQ